MTIIIVSALPPVRLSASASCDIATLNSVKYLKSSRRSCTLPCSASALHTPCLRVSAARFQLHLVEGYCKVGSEQPEPKTPLRPTMERDHPLRMNVQLGHRYRAAPGAGLRRLQPLRAV